MSDHETIQDAADKIIDNAVPELREAIEKRALNNAEVAELAVYRKVVNRTTNQVLNIITARVALYVAIYLVGKWAWVEVTAQLAGG
jgi:hypothetical protein